ncbi:stage II sporulation protein M [Mucilaginibacter ginsenosidivorans]|uniref:Stage II sporulation protein M n=1 Tax=Mucilaginibacter ginsenosidivorans TaxID=398053 RepID=A0A5B8UQB9_9SPHI|nr:stage II sporulation protein M [Mucilaginibacter ginsenosidivorans]QEC61072.1 stage II sporulation protein M [Mucilaginibacter ginsenosidivorans]
MREPLFVKQNAEQWRHFEQAPVTDPDEVAERFIKITDDLAYAKTFYPKSKTTEYLNGLAAKLHQTIYKNKTEKRNRFITFWKLELPVLFKTYERQLLYSFIFFFVFCLMGVLSARYDPNFLRLILGDQYVDMTNDNIAKGDPFGVYKSHQEFLMFMGIAANNIYVSLVIFVSGIIFSVGAVYHLFTNGIMLGSFEYYFFSKGLGAQSVLVIWIHGTIEISSIIIAGAAGLVLGNSLLFPKTYTRLASLKKGARDGMKLAIGLVPLFIIAATFESFVTRHTEMPIWLSITILASSLTFMVWYVIIYPNKINKTRT